MLNYKNRKLSDRAALDSTRSKLIDTYNEQFKIYLNESANDSIKINKQIGDGLEAYNEKFIGQNLKIIKIKYKNDCKLCKKFVLDSKYSHK